MLEINTDTYTEAIRIFQCWLFNVFEYEAAMLFGNHVQYIVWVGLEILRNLPQWKGS